MDGWAKKKRSRSPPPAPMRKAAHAKRRVSVAAAFDDDDAWLAGRGPPVVDGGATPLTCRTSDAEVASITRAIEAAPAARAPPAVRAAAPAKAPAKPALSFDALVRKYPPLVARRLAPEEDDGWLA